MTERKAHTPNSTYTQEGVQCFYESQVLNPSSVLLIKFSAKNPHLGVAANVSGQFSAESKMVNDANRKY